MSKQSALNSYTQNISQINDLLADKGNDVSSAIDEFFTSLPNVTNNGRLYHFTFWLAMLLLTVLIAACAALSPLIAVLIKLLDICLSFYV